MVHRRPARRVLTALALGVIAAAALAWLPATPVLAHDVYDGAYRKWPWKAGTSVTLTTLPGQCPHCSGVSSSSAWKAIDAAMGFETVYAVAPGRVDEVEPSGGKAGKFLRVKDDDGTFITYEHLSSFLVKKGDIVAGEPIAISGNTGNSSGPHLHFQRHDGRAFSSKALPLTPISGHGGSGDPLVEASYRSDNGGIGFNADDNGMERMQRAYDDYGSYDKFGVSSNLGSGLTPCRANGAAGSWFREKCEPNDRFDGSVQTFLGPDGDPRALFHRRGASRDIKVKGGILRAFTQLYGGKDWINWLGYPVSDRQTLAPGLQRQEFEAGWIDIDKKACRETMVVGFHVWRTYDYCD